MSERLNIHEDLYENGYAPVGIDIGRSDMETAMQKYLAFLELDERYHEATRYFNTDRGDGDFGQFTRVAGTEGARGTMTDNKDIFHFGAQTRQVVEARISGTLPHDMKEFLDAAEEIFWAGERSKKRALEELDWLNTGLIGIMSPEIGTINDLLRFIAYYPNEGRLAKGHFDRGVCTLAIGESHEGLRIAKGQNGMALDCSQGYMDKLETSLEPVKHVEGEAKFFLGAGWNRLPNEYKFGNHDLPLGYHDVVESDQQVDNNIMRWAIVQFCNPMNECYGYAVPTPPETRPYKQLGRLGLLSPDSCLSVY